MPDKFPVVGSPADPILLSVFGPQMAKMTTRLKTGKPIAVTDSKYNIVSSLKDWYVYHFQGSMNVA